VVEDVGVKTVTFTISSPNVFIVPLVIFGHAQLDSRIAECLEQNTAFWTFHTIQPSSYVLGLKPPNLPEINLCTIALTPRHLHTACL